MAIKRGQVAIRLENWKGVKVNMKTEKNPRWELYDLSKDISEEKDLANQYPEVIVKLDSILEHEHTIAHEWEFIDPRYKNYKR